MTHDRSAVPDDPLDRHRPWTLVAVGAAITALTGVIVAGGDPGSVEVAVFRWLNDPPGVIGSAIGFVDPLFRPWGLVVVAAVVLALLCMTRRQQTPSIVASAGAAAVLAWALDNAVKRLVQRGRPPEFLDDVLTHGYPVAPHGTGFPSSHTAIVVAIVVGGWPWLTRWWRIGGVALASAIALDRVYVGAHFPLDVVGGAGVGLVAGGLVLAAEQWWRTRGSVPVSGR